MKVVILLAVLTVAFGFVVVPESKVKYADKDFLLKQKLILELFQHIQQNDIKTEVYTMAKSYDIESHYESYTNVEAVKEFVSLYKHGLLPREEIFTPYREEYMNEAIALFHVLYYAKDWDTFYKTMVWARYHVNPAMFIYTATVAVIHRRDLAGLELPAPYEIYPQYFFTTDVIQKAKQLRMQEFSGVKKIDGVYTAVIPSNYTGWHVVTNPSQKLTYWTEDIGLNAYYYYFHTDYPFWMGGQEHGLTKDRRGELYLYKHQQILARYYLERLSNDMGPIPSFSWYKSIKTGYYPSLAYPNGYSFPSRDNYYRLYTDEHYYDVEELVSYERRIRDVIDHGYIVMPDGSHLDLTKPESIEYLGNLVQGNVDSVNTRFYKYIPYFAKLMLGASVTPMQPRTLIPGVLEQYETMMRDPMFYQLYKRIVSYYWQFKAQLPHYTYEELSFLGVKIETVETDKLVTYFDKYESDITNAVYVDEQTPEFLIKARQWRLNHVPFSVKMNIVSDSDVKGIVRLYLGPKYDHLGQVVGVDENRENFVLLDAFPYELKTGRNTVVRDSNHFTMFVKDRTPYHELYKWVMRAYKGEEKFPLDMTEAHCGVPARLMLPKGKKGGMPYQLYVIVSPYKAPSVPQYEGYDSTITCGIGSGARWIDSLPFGYPFDRPIDEKVWFTPNMKYIDSMIYHKKESEINTVV